MTVQERRSVAQRIAELRRLHTVSIFHGSRSDETTELAIATRNLLPVLLAAWEVAEITRNSWDLKQKNLEACFGKEGSRPEWTHEDDEQSERDYKAIHTALPIYREALKGVEDA